MGSDGSVVIEIRPLLEETESDRRFRAFADACEGVFLYRARLPPEVCGGERLLPPVRQLPINDRDLASEAVGGPVAAAAAAGTDIEKA